MELTANSSPEQELGEIAAIDDGFDQGIYNMSVKDCNQVEDATYRNSYCGCFCTIEEGEVGQLNVHRVFTVSESEMPRQFTLDIMTFFK